jgi:hypothetical protein
MPNLRILSRIMNLGKAALSTAAVAFYIHGSSVAQDANAGGALRMISLYDQLEAVCNPIMPMDLEHARQYKLASTYLAKKMLTPKDFDKLLSIEIERRKKEILAAGAKKWCAGERASMIKLGVADVFK